jgi:hypothetical protein
MMGLRPAVNFALATGKDSLAPFVASGGSAYGVVVSLGFWSRLLYTE